MLNRPGNSHKYDYGHVLVVGGSPGMVGAPLLAAMAALRTGAGLATIAASGDVTDKLEKRVEEVMTLSLPSDVTRAADTIADFIAKRKVSVLIIGPGLAVTPETRGLIERLLESVKLPVIIDGGGLGALQQHLDRLDSASSKAITLTPHEGEFQRLVGQRLPAERPDLKPLAAAFAEDHGVTLVLKGHPTYVVHSDGSVYENETGNAGLATAGTGDVLSGIIGGIIAQGVEPGAAAIAAVYLHGLAGDIAAEQKTEPGMIATDVIDAIPAALKHIENHGA